MKGGTGSIWGSDS